MPSSIPYPGGSSPYRVVSRRERRRFRGSLNGKKRAGVDHQPFEDCQMRHRPGLYRAGAPLKSSREPPVPAGVNETEADGDRSTPP